MMDLFLIYLFTLYSVILEFKSNVSVSKTFTFTLSDLSMQLEFWKHFMSFVDEPIQATQIESYIDWSATITSIWFA